MDFDRLGTEEAFSVLNEVEALRRHGRDIVSFAIGDHDCDTPMNIKRAGQHAIEKNMTHYTSSFGMPELRNAVADYFSRTRDVDVGMENVVIMPGGKPLIPFTMLACVEEGDDVIYPEPGYPIYRSMINYRGANPVPAEILESRGFKLDIDALESKITDNTRLLIINSPHNPTGGMLTKDDIERIAVMSEQHDFIVLADEIYSRNVYDGEFTSITRVPGMMDRTVVLDGLSKAYAMTGWRIGYGIMNSELAERYARLATNFFSCVSPFTQMAAVEALGGDQESVDKMVQEFRRRRDLMVEMLNSVPYINCRSPDGAFYTFPNVTSLCEQLGLDNSLELQKNFLYDAGVAVLARDYFGCKNCNEEGEYIRLSFATSMENIEKGIYRIRDYVEAKT